jgi:hypothetical protein
MFKYLCAAFVAIALSGAAALAAPPPGGMQLPPQPKVRPAGIPVSYLMVSPCIQGMGEHWANPKDLTAPIYGTYKGKVIFSEIMVPLKTLNKGFNYPNLAALPGHMIDHVSIEWHPKGHEGMPIPHYDVHAYYVAYTQQTAICPNGIPDPDAAMAMKPRR